jgi:FkbM family methyltransferase
MSSPNLSLIINPENEQPIGVSVNGMSAYNDGDITISFIFAFKTLNETISNDHLIIDVGADKGYFSHLSHVFLPNNYVYAFEPNPISYNSLINTVVKQPNTIVFPFAISDKEQTIKFTLSDSTTNCRDGKGTDTICKPLTNVIEKNRTIYFLKVDVEGHDFEVIKSASQFIENGRLHNIIFEYSAQWLGENSKQISNEMFNYLRKYYKYIYALGRIGEPFAVELQDNDFETFIEEHLQKKQQTDIFVTNTPITYITVVPYEYNKYYV